MLYVPSLHFKLSEPTTPGPANAWPGHEPTAQISGAISTFGTSTQRTWHQENSHDIVGRQAGNTWRADGKMARGMGKILGNGLRGYQALEVLELEHLPQPTSAEQAHTRPCQCHGCKAVSMRDTINAQCNMHSCASSEHIRCRLAACEHACGVLDCMAVREGSRQPTTNPTSTACPWMTFRRYDIHLSLSLQFVGPTKKGRLQLLITPHKTQVPGILACAALHKCA